MDWSKKYWFLQIDWYEQHFFSIWMYWYTSISSLSMKTEHNLLWVLDQNRGNLRLVAVVAEDGIKWRNGKTDNIDNGRSKVKVVHTHATHSYVLSMNYRTTKHIYIFISTEKRMKKTKCCKISSSYWKTVSTMSADSPFFPHSFYKILFLKSN